LGKFFKFGVTLGETPIIQAEIFHFTLCCGSLLQIVLTHRPAKYQSNELKLFLKGYFVGAVACFEGPRSGAIDCFEVQRFGAIASFGVLESGAIACFWVQLSSAFQLICS
jgi:hypothetical protein